METAPRGGQSTYFIGGKQGLWRVTQVKTSRGEPLSAVSRLAITLEPSQGDWTLRGVPSYERYVHRQEQHELAARQPGLGRTEAVCGALIPIRKTAAWWRLAQDERRRIFEEQSGHIRIGMDYLPAVARQLYHARDLGETFDFLTWFEFAPAESTRFDDLLGRLRETEEWKYVEREVEIRVLRDGAPATSR